MSVRPQEVAEGAQRFSLRRVFKALEASSEEPTATSTATSTAPTAPPAPAAAASALKVDLGLRPPTKAHAPLLALSESTSKIKFSLPNMVVAPPSSAPSASPFARRASEASESASARSGVSVINAFRPRAVSIAAICASVNSRAVISPEESASRASAIV